MPAQAELHALADVAPPPVARRDPHGAVAEHVRDRRRVATARLAAGPRDDGEPSAQWPVDRRAEDGLHRRVPDPQERAEERPLQRRTINPVHAAHARAYERDWKSARNRAKTMSAATASDSTTAP